MPQPIDPNTEMGRIVAAERIQQISDRASLLAQARMTTEAEKENVKAESQVQHLQQKSEEVDSELKRRNPYMKKKKRKKKHGQDENKNKNAQHTFYNAAEHQEIVEDPDDHDLDITI
jgi:hypothetical protein